MRRVLSWGLPIYAAIMTGIFVGKSLPDNNLRAEGDVVHSANVKATASSPESSPPPANGNRGAYPIPAPLAQPKHLFHFVIRYEGDGLADQKMIAKAMAAAGQDDGPKKAGKSKAEKAGFPDMFQFIIRYEGDGIVDENVAKLLKAYFAAEKSEKTTQTIGPSATPTPGPIATPALTPSATPAPVPTALPAPATSASPAPAPSAPQPPVR